jgi:hypothetical protein
VSDPLDAATNAGQDPDRADHFRQLKWSLQSLAAAGSGQRALFPEHVAAVGELASDFDRRASAVRAAYGGELGPVQTASLSALDGHLATMSRDGAEYDAELWTDAAVRTSPLWAEVRRLASAALDAFGWTVEAPPRSELQENA